MPIYPNGGFFPTRQQRELIVKGIGHLTDCDCTTDQEMTTAFEVLDIMAALNQTATLGLEDLEDSWNTPGVEE